ncbi:MAG: T9SS type A sorting domain-containing protein [Bacteroidales bacterium]|nr:T9SS type A sorting domain-containing protein [Bacteroidales bacterium]
MMENELVTALRIESLKKEKWINFLILTLTFLLFFTTKIFAQIEGDYRTQANGDWSKKQNWEYFENGSWKNAGQSPSHNLLTTVTILSGHTIIIDKNKESITHLIVEAGAKLYTNSTSTERELEIYGNIQCDGMIGNGPTLDKLTLTLKDLTTIISGSGDCRFFSITKKPSGTDHSGLFINMDVTLYTTTGNSIYNTQNNAVLEIIVNPNASLTSHANIDLRYGNPDKLCKIHLKSDETGYGSLITAGITDSDETNTLVERYISESCWHYICPPIDNAYAEIFFDMYLLDFSEPTGVWTYIEDPETPLESGMHGYATWSSPGLLGNTTVLFEGSLKIGQQSIDVTFTDTATHNSRGFNFVGNPYTSAVDWDYDGPDGWGKDNVDDAIYLWNPLAGVYGSYVNGFSVNDATNILPAHQGFYVHCNAPTGTLSVDHNAKVHSSTSFFKSGDFSEKNIIRLKTDGNGLKDEALIRLDENATDGYDKGFDAYKMLGSENVPQVYSIMDEDLLSINAINFSEKEKTIAIGFVCESDGVYGISWEGLAGFDFSVDAFLEDRVSGNWINIKEQTQYSFSYKTDDPENRFNLHFVGPNNVVSFGSENPSVFSHGKYVYLENLNHTEINEIKIFNMMGQEVLHQNVNSDAEEIYVQKAGYYIVTVIGNEVVSSTKISIQ